MNPKQIIDQVNEDAAAQGRPPLISYKHSEAPVPDVDSTRFTATISTHGGRTEHVACCELTGEVSPATKRAVERRLLGQALGQLLLFKVLHS